MPKAIAKYKHAKAKKYLILYSLNIKIEIAAKAKKIKFIGKLKKYPKGIIKNP